MSVTGNNVLRAVQTMGLSDLETRVIKATYDDYDPPKQKHVDSLISYTNEYNIVPLLEKQLSESKWNVVFKTLVVIHRCTLDGNIKFLKNLVNLKRILNLSDWTDLQGDGRIHVKYIRTYAEYLTAKCDTFKQCTVSLERENPVESKKYINSIDNTTLYRLLPVLIYQFDKLLRCYPNDVTQPVTAASMSLLIKDAFRLYSTLTVSFLQILDLFNTLQLDELHLTSQCIERFTEQNTKFKGWANQLTKLGMIQSKVLPKFDAIPDTFKTLVDEKIAKLESKENKKDKKKKKKKKQPSSDDSESDSEVVTKPVKTKKQVQSSDSDTESLPSPKVNKKAIKQQVAAQLANVKSEPSESEDSDTETERAKRKQRKKEKKLKKLQKQQQQEQKENGAGAFDLMQSFDPVLNNISNAQHTRVQSIDPYTQLQQKGQSQLVPYGQQIPHNTLHTPYAQQQQQYNSYVPQQPMLQTTPPPSYQSQNYYTQQPYGYQQPSAALGYGVPGNPLPAQPTPGNPDLMSRPQPSQQAIDGLFAVPAAQQPQSVQNAVPQQQKKIKQNADQMFSDLL